MNNPKLIGLCGLARSGKDTFFALAREYFQNYDIKCIRFSFADALKYDVKDFLLEKVGISSFTEDDNQKEIIRDFLVAYGTKLMRRMDADYWIKKIQNQVKNSISNGFCPVITDVRYLNELEWAVNMGGTCIHLDRSGNQAPNEEEAENDPLLKMKCDYHLKWDNFENRSTEYRFNIVAKTIDHILNINQKLKVYN